MVQSTVSMEERMCAGSGSVRRPVMATRRLMDGSGAKRDRHPCAEAGFMEAGVYYMMRRWDRLRGDWKDEEDGLAKSGDGGDGRGSGLRDCDWTRRGRRTRGIATESERAAGESVEYV